MAKDFELEHRKRVARYLTQVDGIYNKAAIEAGLIGASVTNFNPDKPFTFADYPGTKHRIDKLTSSMANGLHTVIVNGATAEWEQSNFQNDELAKRVLGYKTLTDLNKTNPAAKFFNNNSGAMDAFLKRKEGGLNLSDRVWKYTNQFKLEIEMVLDDGIRNGKAAASMARDIKQFLKEPDRVYRRFQMNLKDANGNAVLDSKGAKIVIKQERRRYMDTSTGKYIWKVESTKYKPGQGVYRSSLKNSQRLTRTENNMAYRMADHTRIQQFDFVVGIEVKLSKNHKVNDICDTLKGKYPKDFVYTGWHPHCYCPMTFVLKTPDELSADTDQILKGEPTDGESINQIDKMPADFTKWAKDNTERMQKAKSIPYFVRDNFKGGVISGGLNDFVRTVPVAIVKEIISGLTIEGAKKVMADYAVTEIQAKAIDSYTKGDYASINSYLRGLRKVTTEDNLGTIKELEGFLQEAPKLKATSYRGITLDEYNWEDWKGLKKGDDFADKAFLSTSYSQAESRKFAGTSRYQAEFTIKGKNGVLVENFSNAKREGEILFNKGSRFRVESIKVTEKKGITGKAFITMIEI